MYQGNNQRKIIQNTVQIKSTDYKFMCASLPFWTLRLPAARSRITDPHTFTPSRAQVVSIIRQLYNRKIHSTTFVSQAPTGNIRGLMAPKVESKCPVQNIH